MLSVNTPRIFLFQALQSVLQSIRGGLLLFALQLLTVREGGTKGRFEARLKADSCEACDQGL